MTHRVYIGLGSNIGNRAGYLHDALDAMAPFMAVEETSHLYETIPMLMTDQPLFLNAVCKATTALTPAELLRALKQTEVALGRMKTIRYGPRNIDLDILFYDDAIVDTPDLTIPHPCISERDFVLAPLLDLDPDLHHPRLNLTVRALWQQLNKPLPPRVLPIGERLWHWGQRTYVMGILNSTPDSFSGDGLANAPDPVASALARAQRFVADGADVLDIGGYSTRPGHADVPIEEEIRRVAPVIRALAAAGVDAPLSIDTFRVEVAEVALDAGASWLNDVSGLRISSLQDKPGAGMGALAARRRVPLVVMHNRAAAWERGRPARHPDSAFPSGQHLTTDSYDCAHVSDGGGPARSVARDLSPSDRARVYDYKDVVTDVCRELAESLELARRTGVPRWHRIIDPGIGFGKKTSQHATLIARLDEVQRLGYPLLFGSSRKGFLGKMAGGAPVEERLAGTIAANTLAVERGAQIVRVHDVRENAQAMRVVDAIMGTINQTVNRG